MARRSILLILVLALLLHTATPGPALASNVPLSSNTGAQASAQSTGIVRAVLFWMQGCGHCEKVRTEVLPPLQQKYGTKLDILQVEVKDPETSNRLDRAAAALGFASGNVGVPFLIIGNRGLVGSLQIPGELPGLIDSYLESGGVDVPNLPGLENIASIAAQGTKSATQAGDMRDPGFALAWIVFALLIASVLYAGWGALQYRRKRIVPRGSVRLDYALLLLSVVGLIVAFYLGFIETLNRPAVCGPVGDCNAVQSSTYSRLFGVLPVGVLGLFGYVGIIAAWLWWKLRSDALSALAPKLLLAMALFGVLFSIYLTYLELFVINAVCMWCLISAVAIALILLLSVGPALWRQPPAPARRRKAAK